MRLRAQVENRAAVCAQDPALAEAMGLKPTRMLPERGAPIDEAPMAGWLRAAAEELIPPIFEWECISAIGGQCFLVLKRYRGAALA
jgi:hypothetical protein